MSTFSVIEKDVVTFLENLVKTPAVATAVAPVTSAVAGIETAAVGAIAPVGDAIINSVLATLGPVGVGAAPFADAILNYVISGLTKNLSTSTPASGEVA